MQVRPTVLGISVAATMVAALVVANGSVVGAEPGFSMTQAMPLPKVAHPSRFLYRSVSCATTTNCAASGSEYDEDTSVPYVTAYSAGTWAPAQAIRLPSGGVAGSPYAIACPAVGGCLLVGDSVTVDGAIEPLLASQSSGTWDTGATVTPPSGALTGASEHAWISGAWCASAGNCVAVGSYEVRGGTYLAMATTEHSGTWSTPTELPTSGGSVAALDPTLSCSSLGDCTALVAQGSVWTETAGTWGSSSSIAPSVAGLDMTGVGCPTSSTCIAVGLDDDAGAPIAVSYVESAGAWHRLGVPLPLLSPSTHYSGLTSIACATNLCEAVGLASNDNQLPLGPSNPFAVTWSAGTWSPTLEQSVPKGSVRLRVSGFDAVACPSTLQCLATGFDNISSSPSLSKAVIRPYSTVIAPVRPDVAPGAPVAVRVVPRIRGAAVSFQYPYDDGGAEITSFTATAHPGGRSCTATAGGCQITGLTDGRQYFVAVTDDNGLASSLPRLSSHVFAGRPPTTPRHLRVVLVDSTASVAWRASSSPSGEHVLRYVVRAHGLGGDQRGCVTKTTMCTLTGLTKGRTYTVHVVAIDVTGTSHPGTIRFVAT